MHSLKGSIHFPFSAMVRDTINTHGLKWAVQYYCGKHGIPAREFRIFAGI